MYSLNTLSDQYENSNKACMDPEWKGGEGGDGGGGTLPGKSLSYQVSIQCLAIIGLPPKRRFNGSPMLAHFVNCV